jgi:hypothetical protein
MLKNYKLNGYLRHVKGLIFLRHLYTNQEFRYEGQIK